MQLYIIRHGIAHDRSDPDCPDDFHRELTEKGRLRTHKVALALKRLEVECERICSSPLLRAVQTAEILSDVNGGVEVQVTDMLQPEIPVGQTVDWLLSAGWMNQAVFLTGHEPHLSSLVSRLATGGDSLRMDFKKAGVCHLVVSATGWMPVAELKWLMKPSQLLRIGESSPGR